MANDHHLSKKKIWNDEWYGVTFESHVLESIEPIVPALVLGKPLVLWTRVNQEDGGTTICCADDICPH